VVETADQDEERVQMVMQNEPGVVWFLHTLTQGSSDEIFLPRCVDCLQV